MEITATLNDGDTTVQVRIGNNIIHVYITNNSTEAYGSFSTYVSKWNTAVRSNSRNPIDKASYLRYKIPTKEFYTPAEELFEMIRRGVNMAKASER